MTRAPIPILLPILLCAGLVGCASNEPASPSPAAVDVGVDLLSVTDMDGRALDLNADLAAGRPVVLVFWQSWCAPCLLEAPKIAAADRAYRDRLRFVGVISGPDETVDEEAVRDAVARLDLDYAQVRDRDLALTRHFGVEGTPTLVVLDPERGVVYQGHRAPESWETFLPAGVATPARDVLRRRELGVMGTELVIEVIGADPDLLERALDDAVAEIQRVEDVMTDWRESPLTRLNAAAGQGPREVPRELAVLVARALELADLTGGAFDPTFAGVGRLWDFKRQPPVVPSPAEIAAALERVGWSRVTVDLERNTVDLPAGMALGLGGIAKGYGVDRAMATLLEHGIEHALVNAGGDLKALGRKFGEPWRIAVRHPRDEAAVLAVVPISNACLVTSGDYERFFVHEGRRYHHILDPRTGYPADGAISATVVGPDAALADALATALAVLGPEAGLPLVESLSRVEALIVDLEGHVHATGGLDGS